MLRNTFSIHKEHFGFVNEHLYIIVIYPGITLKMQRLMNPINTEYIAASEVIDPNKLSTLLIMQEN